MKILITGINGFVGVNLSQYLINEKITDITGITRNSITNDGRSIQVSYDEILNSNHLKFKNYIHLAGKAHDLKNISDDSEYYEVNYELTKKIYNSFLNDELAETFVFISSVKAVADQVEGDLTEEHVPEPITAYGKSKLKAENYILDNLRKGKRVIILRPCMIHGPGNKGNLNLLFSIVKSGIPWPLGAFKNSRSFLSVENLNFVIKEILKGSLKTGIYNVADSGTLSTNNLIQLISESNSNKTRILNVPQSLIKFIAKIGDILRLPFNSERLQKLTDNYVVSNKKLVSELGKQLPVSASDGMRITIQSLINENA
jgi:nucleoside-diphosphate-sugar epimerase